MLSSIAFACLLAPPVPASPAPAASAAPTTEVVEPAAVAPASVAPVTEPTTPAPAAPRGTAAPSMPFADPFTTDPTRANSIVFGDPFASADAAHRHDPQRGYAPTDQELRNERRQRRATRGAVAAGVAVEAAWWTAVTVPWVVAAAVWAW